MPTPVFCCGFECGVLSLAGGHWSTVTGTGAISTTTVRNGARSFRSNPTASNGYTQFYPNNGGSGIPASVTVYRFAIYFTTLPSADVLLSSCQGDAVNWAGAVFKVSDSKIYAGTATSMGASGVSVTTGQWYYIDVKLAWGGNPWLVDVQVNGTACGQSSLAFAAQTDFNGLRLGVQTTSTADVFYDDVIVSVTSADYPFGDGKVNHFVPTSDGTHTSTGTTTVKGTNATPVGAAITSATTDAFNWVNAVPILGGATDNTRLINAQTAASTTYAEVKFGAAPGISTPTVAPRAVEVFTADRQASTAAGSFQIKLNDNGTEGVVVNRGVTAGFTTDRYSTKQFATPPTGGAWNAGSSGAGAFNNIKGRFGYSSDATPDQYWRGIMIEAEFVAAVTPSIPNKIYQKLQAVNRANNY